MCRPDLVTGNGEKDNGEAMSNHRPESRWMLLTDVALLVLSLIFLVLYAVPIINPDLNPVVAQTFDVSMNLIWGLFIVDYLGNLLAADDRKAYVRSRPFELFSVIVPFARPLRALMLLSVVTISLRRFSSRLRNRVAVFVVFASTLVWFITGLAITEAERGVDGSTINHVSDGWWWSFITMATVGYGDTYPLTGVGQWIAVVVVLNGIVLLGTASAVLASWLIEDPKGTEQQILLDAERTYAVIADLTTEVQSLRRENAVLSERIRLIVDESTTRSDAEQ